MNVAIPIVGQTYSHRSLPLSSQVTRNWYPEINPEGKDVISLMPTPGAKAFCAGTSGEFDRGMHVFSGALYKVSGTRFYRVSSAGVETLIGTINGTSRCSFIDDGSTMVIVTGGSVYSYNGTSLTLATDVDFESPNTVAYLNNQAIYDGVGARWCVSDAGALTTINSLNYASAESAGDSLVRVYVFNQILYLMGERTIEPWFNSGDGTPPYDRIEAGIIQVGLGARWSVANNDNFIYFLSDDRSVYRISGTTASRLSNPAIGHTFQSYGGVSDAIGMCFSWNGDNFYLLSIPSQDKTFVYSEAANMMFEMSSGMYGGRHLANSYTYCYGKRLIADFATGGVFEWDFDTYTDNSETIRRVRHSRTIDGASFGAPGKQVFMDELEVIINSGTATLSGQGSSPNLMLRYSDDGGRTWSSYINGFAGQISQHTWRILFSPLGSFYERIIEISATDPIAWEIYSARADVDVGI